VGCFEVDIGWVEAGKHRPDLESDTDFAGEGSCEAELGTGWVEAGRGCSEAVTDTGWAGVDKGYSGVEADAGSAEAGMGCSGVKVDAGLVGAGMGSGVKVDTGWGEVDIGPTEVNTDLFVVGRRCVALEIDAVWVEAGVGDPEVGVDTGQFEIAEDGSAADMGWSEGESNQPVVEECKDYPAVAEDSTGVQAASLCQSVCSTDGGCLAIYVYLVV
jgi:hypothetical protein